MKNTGMIIFIIIGLVTLVIYFDIPAVIQKPPKQLSAEDSLSLAISDSINQVRLDSIAAVRAYENRHWKLGNFVDEFGDLTGEKNIRTTVEGTFSNSATRDSYLYARILITKVNAGIFLHEYQRSGPAEKFIGSGTIMLRNSNNEDLRITTSRSWGQDGGLLIDNSIRPNFSQLRNFLMKSVGEVRVVIRDQYSSVYNFTIDATGFTAGYIFL